MEGNYRFVWQAVEATGQISGVFAQTIYAPSTGHALARFIELNGELGPDQNGTCFVIIHVSWQPYVAEPKQEI